MDTAKHKVCMEWGTRRKIFQIPESKAEWSKGEDT